jgi:hypothetical protein
MYSERAKLWLKFLILSFIATMFIMVWISLALYHNGFVDAVQESFIPSTGASLIFSLVVFIRPQN